MSTSVYSIAGTTATGKTNIVLSISKVLEDNRKVFIISADSRQVYKEIPLISGSDIPADFFQSTHRIKLSDVVQERVFYKKKSVSLFGIGLINADEEWSLAHFQDYVWQLLEKAKQENAVILLVGGTGLYHQRVLHTELKQLPGPNKQIRSKARDMSIENLQKWLQKENKKLFENLNNSDKFNKIRLIRGLEKSTVKNIDSVESSKLPGFKQEFLVLSSPLSLLKVKIKERVLTRINAGAIQEVENVLRIFPDNSLPIWTATGVKEIKQYLDKQLSFDEMIEEWTTREYQYAKRQITWWKRFDYPTFLIEKKEDLEQVEECFLKRIRNNE